MVVRGDPGIGKSTLLRAAVDHARDRGYLLLSTVGTPAEQHLPFAALHHLLRTGARQLPHDWRCHSRRRWITSSG